MIAFYNILFAILCISFLLTDRISAGSSDSSTSTDTSSSDSSSCCQSSSTIYYSKCKPYIVAKIFKLWDCKYGEGQWPTDLIKKSELNGKETIVYTTEGYYANIFCLYSYINDGNVATTSVYPNGTCVHRNFTISECEGKTISNSSGAIIYRYHVIQEQGCIGVYTCIECGVHWSADYKPDGFVKIDEDNYNATAIPKVKECMENVLGEKFEVSYPWQCKCEDCED